MLRPWLTPFVLGVVGLGCTAAEPPTPLAMDAFVAVDRSDRRDLDPSRAPEVPRICPAGTERRERGGEGPESSDWWCTRDGDVRHGPFFVQDFDVRDRGWSDIEGEYRDGELHGRIDHSRGRQVFRREVYDRGRKLSSNELLRVESLDRAHPRVTRRAWVKAAGLWAVARGDGDPDAVGTLDAMVSTTWTGQADATPSVLRVEVSTPWGEPAIADGLLYSSEHESLPEISSSLPFGDLPTASASWLRCDRAGCEFPVDVTLRWLVPGDGQLDVGVTVRAVPNTWPEDATINVRTGVQADGS